MEFKIVEGKLFCKKLFSNKEINGKEIESITVTKEGTRIRFKAGKKEYVAKDMLKFWFEDILYITNNNISYEDTTQGGEAYSANQITEMLEKTKKTAKIIAGKNIKEQLGEDYDIDVEIVGEYNYSILVFRLMERGQVLYNHPSYQEIGELGVDNAIDEMDLSWLIKWDATFNEGLYQVTNEVLDEAKLEDYIVNFALKDRF